MQKVYQRINWENEPSTKSPINDDNLNKMDYAIDQIDSRVVQLSGYEERVAQSEKNAKASETNAKTSEINAKESELKAKEYKEQAFSGTPEGYEALVEEVHRMDIAKSNGYTYQNTKKGGLRLLELVGNTVQNGEPSPNNPIAIENTFDCVEIENGDISSTTGAYLTDNSYVRTKRFIPCSPNDVINVKTSIIKSIFINYFNENGFVVTQKVLNTDEATFTTPSGATKFIVSVGRSSDPAISPKEIKISLTVNGKYVGQIVEHGKNFVKYNKPTNTTKNGVTITYNDDGSITLNGTCTEWFFVNLNYKGANGRNLPNGKYKIINTHNKGFFFTGFVNSKSVNNSNKYDDCSFELTDDSASDYLRFEIAVNTVLKNETIYPLIVREDETDLTYEPYTEKITTFFLDEPLREGDRLVKMDGVWYVERKIKEVDMGSLSWGYDNTYSRFLTNALTDKSNRYTNRKEPMTCECYTVVIDGRSIDKVTDKQMYGGSGTTIWVHDYDYTDITEFKNAISGKKLQYEIATPTLTPLDAQSQIALNSLETFDTITYLEVDSKVKPSGIEVEYGTSKVGALSLENANLRDNLNFTCAKYNVANNLSTTKEGFVLDARQGRFINSRLVTLESREIHYLSSVYLSKFMENMTAIVENCKDAPFHDECNNTALFEVKSVADSLGNIIVMQRYTSLSPYIQGVKVRFCTYDTRWTLSEWFDL